ncbi:MAG: D-glycero-D-manno-heptose 1 7-bisphosphate phosphatase [Candidatus Saganbacteria bacterium]|uniref:D,D-heptose 1,7-bisphosphate phosphatase n=1 Tax=Candidatus Saganbacteria bacterium TaxID=2575572 RepID=A0A833NWD2_UNCSA|nr:MAG: D-glycero-D-manno-heptose 1 7-bisphosphate phosphatase [Candidatus Saganbacteria bacterium]
MNKAVFLDKDGTINDSLGYLGHYKELNLLPHSAEAIKLLNEAGYKTIVISNQSGIARGYFSEDMVQAIDKTLQKYLLNQGAFIDAFYYCPHHPEKNCDCRKPNIELINKAVKRFDIDIKSSFFIGDNTTDMMAGKKAGLKTIFVLTGHGKKKLDEVKASHNPDYIADHLLEAVKWILKK